MSDSIEPSVGTRGRPIRVAVVEDDPGLAAELAGLLRDTAGMEWVGSATDGAVALGCMPAWAPDVAVMDIRLPGLSGIECVRRLKGQLPGTEFLMLTVLDDAETVFEALRAGATGYLAKSAVGDGLVDAIRDLAAGGSPMSGSIARKVIGAFRRDAGPRHPAWDLSLREEEVLRSLSGGKQYKEIADALGLSVHTVRTHLHNVSSKLQARNKADAVRIYRSRGPGGPG